MRLLFIVTMWIGTAGALDIVSFNGGYSAASVQWAQNQGREVRYGVRHLMDKAFGK
jgi:hypothetical protein